MKWVMLWRGRWVWTRMTSTLLSYEIWDILAPGRGDVGDADAAAPHDDHAAAEADEEEDETGGEANDEEEEEPEEPFILEDLPNDFAGRICLVPAAGWS